MSVHASKTIWWYLWRELVRLLLITATVVVVVTSFAVAVKPLADGRLGPLDTLKLMALASIPMLQYALPFAAGFAATLAYHRMSSENELNACYAGGISHKSVLVPAAFTGMVLAAGLFVLADQVMPRFLRRMSELISDDVMRLMQNSFSRGEALSIDGRNMFYADALIPGEVPPGSAASKHFVLQGLVAAQVEPNGTVSSEVSSRYALVWLFPGTGGTASAEDNRRTKMTTVVMQLRDSIVERQNVRVPEMEQSTIVYPVPLALNDDPKYHSWVELEATKARPERMDWIDADRRRLASRLAERETADKLAAELKGKGRASLTDPAGRSVVIRGGGLTLASGDKGFLIEPPGREKFVEVVTQPDDARVRTFRAPRVYLSMPVTPDGKSSQLTIEMDEVAAGDESGVVSEYKLNGLTPANDPLPSLLAMSSKELVALAQKRQTGTGEDALSRQSAGLSRQLSQLQNEILSKQHERVAASLACLVMVMTGAVMAMRLRDSMPLAVYLWSFLPALGSLFTIAGGQTLTHTHGATGLFVLYGGVVVLALWTFVEYRKVAIH